MDALRRLAGGAQQKTSAGIPTFRTIDEDFDDFLDLFQDLQGLIPSSFFLLFKIARVLKSADAKLAGQLKGFFDICRASERRAPIESPDRRTLDEKVPVITTHDPEWGGRRIRGIEELTSVLPKDLAEEEFTDLLRKAEERELKIRVLLRTGETQGGSETAPITAGGSRQLVNAAEQKLYILLDRSYSMRHRHRLLYAKVLAIEYLRNKKRTNARLFFRPFDFDVYELEKLADPQDYDRLIRKLLFIEPGGKGTDITHALQVAAQDIQFDGMFENAEILLITDGMDRIEIDEIKEMLGERILLHMVKIGRDAAEPQQSEIEDMKKEMLETDQSAAILTREDFNRIYNERLTAAWEKVTETLLETDDFQSQDVSFGDQEVQFALDAASKILAVEADLLSLTEIESLFRRASFVEGFIDLLLEQAEKSPAVEARRADLETTGSNLTSFKLKLAALTGISAGMLATKDLRFVNDKVLRRQAKKARLSLDDLAQIQEADALALQLKLGGAKPSAEGEGMSLWRLLRLVGKATAKSLAGWLFKEGRKKGEAEEEEGAVEEKEDAEKA